MTVSYSHRPDIDILPEKYRWRFITWIQVALIVVLVAAGAVGYSLYQGRAQGQQRLDTLQTELRRLLSAADALAPQVKQAQELRQEIGGFKTELQKLETARAQYQEKRLDWAALLPPLFLSPPQGIELKSVVKKEQTLTVEGNSYAGYPAIAKYHDQLAAAPGVIYVDINKAQVLPGPASGEYTYFSIDLKLRGK